MAIPRPTPQSLSIRTLQTDVAALASAQVRGGSDLVISGISMDSRAVQAGDLYAALPGFNVHGARFAPDAVGLGASAILTDPAGAELVAEQDLEVPVIVVDDPRGVLGECARVIYGSDARELHLIGVTGTNGKTTTSYLIASALEAMGRATGLIGTVEMRIGEQRVKSVRTTPEATDLHALLAVMGERHLDTCVMEVSSHALSMHRVDGVIYDVALFTNLSQDHLDFHPTMADYFEAKAMLFTPEHSRHGVVCVDDEWGRRLHEQASVPVTTMSSTGAAAQWQVVVDASDPAAFELRGPSGSLRLRSALPGDFNVVNTAMAALALIVTGADLADVELAIGADPHVPGRMETVSPSRPDPAAPLAVVDYAHTPEAVEAALKALRPTTTADLIVVLGAGGDRDRGKRAGMGRAAARHADVVIVTDDNPRTEQPAAIRAAVLSGAQQASDAMARVVEEVEGRSAAISAAVAAARAAGPGATIAIVGKGHETGQEINGEVHPFDDRDELRSALDQEFGL